MTFEQDDTMSGQPKRLSLTDLGRRLLLERKKQGLTLARLAEQSGSSKSMISAIERGERTPSVLLLDQIANALGISVSRLIAQETSRRVIVIERAEQKILADSHHTREGATFHRRVTSPVIEGVDFEMGRLEIDPFVDAGVYSAHLSGWAEYVVVEQGTLEIGLDGIPHTLHTGDAIYFASDCEHSYKNPGAEVCVAYLVMVDQPHDLSATKIPVNRGAAL